MFVLSLLLGLALAGTAVSFGLRAAALPRIDSTERLRRIGEYGFVKPAPDARSLKSVVAGWAERMGSALMARSDRLDEAALRRELVAAGVYDMTPAAFVGYRVLAAIATPLFVLWLEVSAGANGLIIVVLMVMGTAAGWVIPSSIVHRRASNRLAEIERSLPELIDLIVVTVEAGLGFSSAMKTAANHVKGPLGDELKLTLQETNLGLSVHEALENMLERAQTPSMRSFVRSVLQGETLGVSIGSIMRNLAVEMRQRRRVAAEEQAHKAPVKLMFPLIFLIFPSLFIVLLYPAVYEFVQAFGNG